VPQVTEALERSCKTHTCNAHRCCELGRGEVQVDQLDPCGLCFGVKGRSRHTNEVLDEMPTAGACPGMLCSRKRTALTCPTRATQYNMARFASNVRLGPRLRL
jgi:hypothetical protein